MTRAMKVLVPVDGSAASERAVMHVVRLRASGSAFRVLLLNVQPAWAPARSEDDAREGGRLHQQAAARAMRSARTLLDQAQITYETRMLVGDAAEQLADRAVTVVK